MMGPSKSGIAIISVSFCLYLVSIQSVSGLLFLILGILFACLVINTFRARHSTMSLKVIPPKSVATTEGEPLNLAWTIENTSTAYIGYIEVESMWGTILRIPRLGPKECRHLTPKLKFNLRGIYRFSGLKFVSTYPFGLIRYRRRVSCMGEIIVYPSVYRCPPPIAAGFEPMLGGRFSGKYRSRTGELFHGVKPFQPQDPVKLIHWRSSSKGLGLMVKEFDEQLSGRVSIILATDQGKKVDNESSFDWAARVAGSLMLSALDVGYQVEFINLSDLKLISVPPFVDGDVVLEVLAYLTPSSGPKSSCTLNKAISSVSSKSGLSIILTEISMDCIDSLREVLRAGTRKIAVYLPSHLSSDQLDDFSGTPIYFYSKNEILPA